MENRKEFLKVLTLKKNRQQKHRQEVINQFILLCSSEKGTKTKPYRHRVESFPIMESLYCRRGTMRKFLLVIARGETLTLASFRS